MADMIPVDSSCFSELGYDIEAAILYCAFDQGGSYQYYDFPKDEWDAFIAASSFGVHFNAHIRNEGYSYSRIPF